ncbi:MAG: hypothetical protein BroJett024_02640 [Alphaproteobacteria bacterium]|nr:MAG: hypothetical protein BroJett024_02640 [Alphaproteobacteria bacterium]
MSGWAATGAAEAVAAISDMAAAKEPARAAAEIVDLAVMVVPSSRFDICGWQRTHGPMRDRVFGAALSGFSSRRAAALRAHGLVFAGLPVTSM